MAEPRVIQVDPESEIGKLLELVEDEPISIEYGEKRFRIERERKDLVEDYDPAKSLERLRSVVGLFSDIDVEAFKHKTLASFQQRLQAGLDGRSAVHDPLSNLRRRIETCTHLRYPASLDDRRDLESCLGRS